MAAKGKMEKDPVCGMMVDTGKPAATRVFEGKTYYFCSPGCARQFDTDAKRYTHEEPHQHQ